MSRHRGPRGLVALAVLGLVGCASRLDRGYHGAPLAWGTGIRGRPVLSAPPPSAETARPLTSAVGERRTNQGFRIGMIIVDGAGVLADWLERQEKDGQFFALGYQFEIQRGMEGETNTLVEIIPSIAGMGQSWVIPSVNILVGLRFPNGFEFGAGPHFAPRKHVEEDPEDPYGYDKVHAWGLGLTVGMGVTCEAQAEGGSLRIPIGFSAAFAADGVTYAFTVGFNVRRQ